MFGRIGFIGVDRSERSEDSDRSWAQKQMARDTGVIAGGWDVSCSREHPLCDIHGAMSHAKRREVARLKLRS